MLTVCNDPGSELGDFGVIVFASLHILTQGMSEFNKEKDMLEMFIPSISNTRSNLFPYLKYSADCHPLSAIQVRDCIFIAPPVFLSDKIHSKHKL